MISLMSESEIKETINEALADAVSASEAQSDDVGIDNAEEVTVDLEAEVKRLAGLPLLEFEQVRVSEAERLGVRVTVLSDEVAGWFVRVHPVCLLFDGVPLVLVESGQVHRPCRAVASLSIPRRQPRYRHGRAPCRTR